MILLQLRAFLVSSEKNLLLYFFFQLTMRAIRLCLEIDDDNQCFFLFPCGFCIAFSLPPILWAAGFQTND